MASLPRRRGRAIVATALALTFGMQEFAWATCTLTDYPASLPFNVTPGNWAGPGTFTGPKGAIFIPDASTVENGFPTNGGHWWVADGATALCRMSLDSTGHWVIPLGLPANLCSSGIKDTLGQIDYDGARQLIYGPGRKTSVWRIQLAEASDGSGKQIAGFKEVRPSSQPLPEGSGLDALALNDDGSQFYVVSRNNPNVWACINPSDPTLATTRCKQIANGVDGKKIFGASFNHTTHGLWLAETNNLSTIDNVDRCFLLNTPCQAHITNITFFAGVLRPTAVLNFGRFLYVSDEVGRIVQANLDTDFLTDPNAGRILTYLASSGSFVTGFGADPTDGLQIFIDPGLPGVLDAGQVTRVPLCPSTP